MGDQYNLDDRPWWKSDEVVWGTVKKVAGILGSFGVLHVSSAKLELWHPVVEVALPGVVFIYGSIKEMLGKHRRAREVAREAAHITASAVNASAATTAAAVTEGVAQAVGK